MELDDQHTISLSNRELMLLGAGLKAYLSVFAAHRAEDPGATHPESEWEELRNQVGRLICRFEEVGAGPRSLVEHTPDAVNPDA